MIAQARTGKQRKKVVLFFPLLAIAFAALFFLLYHFLGSPNYSIILITIDALRASHLSIYGYDKNTSPEIDKLAREGLLFVRSSAAAPSTGPSIGSLMTSKYPSFHGMVSNIIFFPQENVTLAEVLKKHDYITAAFVGSSVLTSKIGLAKGFQFYDDSCPEREKATPFPERIATTLTTAAGGWLEKNCERKFFLWLHYQDPHGPYMPPYPYNQKFSREAYKATRDVPLLKTWDNTGWGGIPWYQILNEEHDARFYLSQYDGEIAFVDDQIGKLLRLIKRLGLEKKTIVILTADHGEALDNEHGYFFSHEHGLTDDQVRVPLIMKYPGCPRGKQIQTVVSLVDIMPTLLEMLKISRPNGIQGENLFKRKEDVIFAENHMSGDSYSLRIGRYKLVDNAGKRFFYDLETDADELGNRYDSNSNLCAGLDKLLTEYMQEAKQAKIQKLPYKPTPEEIRRLRSLGYISHPN